MEFVGIVEDIVKVVGTVEPLQNNKGIQMSLPEDTTDQPGGFYISRIVYGETSSGKRYIETQSNKGSNWPIYGEASIPEVLAFAKKAVIDMPGSIYTRELYVLACHLKVALDIGGK